MTFTLTIRVGGRLYRMIVEQTFANDWREVYTVSAGDKRFVLRNNRPEIQKFNKRGNVSWQLVSKNFAITNIEQASELMLRIQDMIEDRLDPAPTFQQLRNKNLDSS